ncbi:MAG TPA: OprD family outer membrane porin [Lacibacter sp.]|nr:OprD family outer membrane porin [Lacibacter sp.]
MKWFLLVMILGAALQPMAQEHRTERNDTIVVDSSIHSLNQFFKKGKFFAHARSFVMTTINKGDLSDYGAWGLGAGIGYESATFKGFQFAVSGFFINNTLSADFTKRDPQTQTLSRYELSLFDITDPENKHDLDRLEELYIRYNFKRSSVTYGKQYLNTPYINQQDGRMRPTMEKGLWLELNEFKNIKLQAGWISSISPRSTVKWYSIGNSIGLYSVGVNENGIPSGFKGHLQTKGIAVFNAQWQQQQKIKMQFWNYWVENIFNTAMLQTDAELPFTSHSNNRFLIGLQLTHQSRTGKGGNADLTKAYVQPGYKSYIISSRAGVKLNATTVTANYTRITAHGRFLFPREWGRDPFYTFLVRERNEGLGDVHAYVLSAQHQPKNKNWQAILAAGWYDVPHTTNYQLNKYSMPSYYHLVADVRYQFKGFLKGTSLRLIYLYKGNLEKDLAVKRNIINKVEMHHLNFIIDYWFGKE